MGGSRRCDLRASSKRPADQVAAEPAAIPDHSARDSTGPAPIAKETTGREEPAPAIELQLGTIAGEQRVTTTLGYIGGRVFAFGAKDPGSPELVVLDVTGLIP